MIAGTLLLAKTNPAFIQITPLAGFGTPVPGERWLIMTYGGGLDDRGATIGSAPGGAQNFAVDTSEINKIYITAVVPESASAALAFLGFLLLRATLCRSR